MLRVMMKIFLGALLLALLAFGYFLYLFSSQPFGPGELDFAADLGHGYTLQRTSSISIYINPGIPEKVISLDHDDTWLIAKQQHVRSLKPDDPENTSIELDGENYSYWIAHMPSRALFGPLTEEDFNTQRKASGVPDTLKLHDVYDYAHY